MAWEGPSQFFLKVSLISGRGCNDAFWMAKGQLTHLPTNIPGIMYSIPPVHIYCECPANRNRSKQDSLSGSSPLRAATDCISNTLLLCLGLQAFQFKMIAMLVKSFHNLLEEWCEDSSMFQHYAFGPKNYSDLPQWIYSWMSLCIHLSFLSWIRYWWTEICLMTI